MRIYLDNAATTPAAREVVEAMLPYFAEKFGNPSSIHQYGREAKAAIEKARKSIARMLNAAPAEIIFTSGGTESANMIIYGAVFDLQVTRLITSRIEHHCVLHTAESLFRRLKVEYVSLDEKGSVDYVHLEQLLASSEKTLVSLMHANNEIGNITDIERVGELCKKHNAYFFSDTVQTIGHRKFDLQKIHVHFISGSAHKFHGPKGTGFLYMRPDAMLKPLLHGGSQERNLRAGTENLPGIIGMEKAMSLAYSRLDDDQHYLAELKNYFYQKLKNEYPGIRVNGDFDNSLPKILNVSFPPSTMGDYLVQNLDISGIAASAGSACASGSVSGSHVLKVLNVPENRSSVRFSFSRYTRKDELDAVLAKLRDMMTVGT
ncbi:MAG TPA: cysteine desulfurase family protein [Chitinophagales bacterium]|nr:cysteine desulfurase family protein [Chitinophagales bacterium]